MCHIECFIPLPQFLSQINFQFLRTNAMKSSLIHLSHPPSKLLVNTFQNIPRPWSILTISISASHNQSAASQPDQHNRYVTELLAVALTPCGLFSTQKSDQAFMMTLIDLAVFLNHPPELCIFLPNYTPTLHPLGFSNTALLFLHCLKPTASLAFLFVCLF